MKRKEAAALKTTAWAIATLAFSILIHSPALAEGMNCLTCHKELTTGKVVHAAIEMGCPTCHAGIDASAMPHKKTNKSAKGLSSEQPELCYGCHDKAKFAGKHVHEAIGMGCTGCHNPHSSANAKLLKAKLPELCYNCHDKGEFGKKNVHMPVAGGECLTCHKPHASENIALLTKEPIKVCLECHADVRKKPHAVTGFAMTGHSIGLLRRGDKEFKDDPARKGKKFYCGSCHNPHSSDYAKLYRYKANAPFDLCTYCHKM